MLWSCVYQAVLIDGRTGEVVGKLGKDGKAHSGGIYSVSASQFSSWVWSL